jgi:hypothetical protein
MTEYKLTVHELNRKLFWWGPITDHERYLIYRVLSEDAQYEMGALADAIEREAFLADKLAVAEIDTDEFRAFTGAGDEAMYFWSSRPFYGDAGEFLCYIICSCYYAKKLSLNRHLFPSGDEYPDDLEVFLYPYDYIE